MKKQLFLLITLLAGGQSAFCSNAGSSSQSLKTVAPEVPFYRFPLSNFCALCAHPNYTNSLPSYEKAPKELNLRDKEIAIRYSANALAHNAVTNRTLTPDQIAGCFIANEDEEGVPFCEILSFKKVLWLLGAARGSRTSRIVQEYEAQAIAATKNQSVQSAVHVFVQFLQTAPMPKLDELEAFANQYIKKVAQTCKTRKDFLVQVQEHADQKSAVQSHESERHANLTYSLVSTDWKTLAKHEGIPYFHCPYSKHQVVPEAQDIQSWPIFCAAQTEKSSLNTKPSISLTVLP